MNPPAPISISPFASSQQLLSPALFTLDRNGLILTVTSNALHFWQTTASHVANTPFAQLFVFDNTSVAKSGPEAQWTLLLANTLDRTIACEALLPGTMKAEVGVRIEESQGGAPGYFAIVEDPTHHRDSSPPMVVDSGLALLANNSAAGFFDLNFKAKQIYYSPTWKNQLGYSDQELTNDYASWQRLIHPDDSAAAPDHTQRKPKPGTCAFSVEMRMHHREGHFIWVQCLGTQVIGQNGELERVSGLQLDINERKELDEQTQLNDERLRKLSSSGNLLTFDFDFARGKYWLSPGWKKLSGEDHDEADSELDSFLKALPESAALRGAEMFFLTPSPEQSAFVEAITLRGPSSELVPALIGAHRQINRKGGLARAVGFCCPLPADLKANLSAVSTLPIPANLVTETLQSLTEAVIVADTQGRVTFLNQHAERLTSCKLSASRGTPINEIFRLTERITGKPDRDALNLALASTDHVPLCANHSIEVKDGIVRPIVWNARQILNADHQIEGLVIIFRNPEEMTLTPEELITINRWESLGVIAGGISHDFNNLLTTILGGISQAKDNKDSSYLADSERACLAAKALTKQLLAAAKGSTTSTTQVIAPADLLEEAVRLARAGSTATIDSTIPSSVSSICGNQAQMMQVFQNLIINAIQAVPSSGGKISLKAENAQLAEGELQPLPAGNYVAIEIKDNGAGIAHENLEKIFEQFFTTKKHGTGLGLSTVRNIVRKHGGYIKVASKLGVGTTFTVLLPEADKPAETAARRTPILRTGTGRVLLMDDDPDISRLASGMLASLDYKYDVARNGEDAITLYNRYLKVGRPYDLVILDLTVIGGMGGEDTFRTLKKIDPEVRAIVCSGYDSDEMAHQYMEMGFVGYLSKPFRLGDLARAIKGVLG